MATIKTQTFGQHLAKQRDFSFWGDDYLKEYYMLYVQHRDSELITRSNWQAIVNELDKKEIPYEIISFNHWLVGYIEYLLVAPIDNNNDSTLDYCDDVLNQLDDYPLYDEGLYSQMEYDEFIECLSNELNYKLRNYDYNLDTAINLYFDYDDNCEYDYPLDSAIEQIVTLYEHATLALNVIGGNYA